MYKCEVGNFEVRSSCLVSKQHLNFHKNELKNKGEAASQTLLANFSPALTFAAMTHQRILVCVLQYSSSIVLLSSKHKFSFVEFPLRFQTLSSQAIGIEQYTRRINSKILMLYQLKPLQTIGLSFTGSKTSIYTFKGIHVSRLS